MQFPRIKFQTIEDGLARKDDNFLLLRVIAASLVIYGHAPPIAGGYAPKDLFLMLGIGHYSGDLAVNLFFAISGFLVTGSYVRRSNLVEFAWARALRLVPAYAVCLLALAYVVGPIFTIRPIGRYLTDPDTFHYFWKNIQFQPHMVWRLPDVFLANPKRATVNGAIWTLPAEARMYCYAALFGFLGLFRWRWLFNAVFAAAMAYCLVVPHAFPFAMIPQYERLAVMFAMGMFCYINRGWIPVSGFVLAALVGLSILLRGTPAYPAMLYVTLAYFALWFAYGTRWTGFNRFGDCSYGIYLWGYPVQQVFAALYPTMPALANAALSLVVATAIASASWHGVEKPALAFKGVPRALWKRVSQRTARGLETPGSRDAGAGAPTADAPRQRG